MKKITLLTILSLIFLASCGEAKNTSEIIDTTSEEIKVAEVKNEITRISRRDEVMIDRLLEWLSSKNDKEIFLDYKKLEITRVELRVKLEELKQEKQKQLEEANISWNSEEINKIIEEIRILEEFRL